MRTGRVCLTPSTPGEWRSSPPDSPGADDELITSARPLTCGECPPNRSRTQSCPPQASRSTTTFPPPPPRPIPRGPWWEQASWPSRDQRGTRRHAPCGLVRRGQRHQEPGLLRPLLLARGGRTWIAAHVSRRSAQASSEAPARPRRGLRPPARGCVTWGAAVTGDAPQAAAERIAIDLPDAAAPIGLTAWIDVTLAPADRLGEVQELNTNQGHADLSGTAQRTLTLNFSTALTRGVVRAVVNRMDE